ncbi:MAG: GTPase HflX [Bryobacteraceae bacterium]
MVFQRHGARKGDAHPVAAGARARHAEELAALAATAGAEIVGEVVQSRPAPNAATLIGAGKVRELAELVHACGAELVLFDHDLTPTQQRNLERELGCRVIDRTQLILDIFAQRARTREGQLQVELAQLQYLLPRLTGRGVEMSRLGGGIGTRGPGETQLETDRRRILRRIRKIREELQHVRQHRAVQRRKRQSVPLATAALVGYTNAGKSTLFNRLTGAEVTADARLFATLDPTIRAILLPSRRKVLLSDTVGFIRDLPPSLVEAFRATLEEVTEAALLLHVVDAASERAAEEAEQVQRVLSELGCEGSPQLLVLNKIDLLPEDGSAEAFAARIGEGRLRSVAISAKTGQGLGQLLKAIDAMLPVDEMTRVQYRVPSADGWAMHSLHELGRVCSVRYQGDTCEVEAEVPESLRRRLRRYEVQPCREGKL